MDIGQLLKQREDEKSRGPAETLASKIDKYIAGELSGDAMDELYKSHAAAIGAELRKRQEAPREHARAIWTGAKDAEQYYQEQRDWCSAHPQLIQTYVENIQNIAAWMRERDLAPSAENVNEAFIALAMEGRLLLDAVACHAGPESEVTGDALRRHNNLHLLLEPVRPVDTEQRKTDRMSADAYLAEHDELKDWRVPPILIQKVNQILNTWVGSHLEYVRCPENEAAMTDAVLASRLPVSLQLLDSVYRSLLADGALKVDSGAVAEYGASRIIDMGARPHGFPKESEKYSFKMKIRSMTADQIAERCANDPQFKSALDNL
jgi:hypothetical protein